MATPRAKWRKKPLAQGHGCDLSQRLELNSSPAHQTQVPLAKSESNLFLVYKCSGNHTTQAYADDNTEKPGHTFPSFLLVPCVRQHWLYEHFYFLCHINFPSGKKDCIKIIRLLMEGLITNKVGFFYPLYQTIFFIPCVKQIK